MVTRQRGMYTHEQRLFAKQHHTAYKRVARQEINHSCSSSIRQTFFRAAYEAT